MPERQCGKCTRQDDWGCEAVRFPSKEGDPTAYPDKNGNWWGWHKGAVMSVTLDGEESRACPRQTLKRHPQPWQKMLLYYGMYRKGHLPQVGAVMDQSNKAIELFRVLDEINFECDAALEAEDRAKRRREAPLN